MQAARSGASAAQADAQSASAAHDRAKAQSDASAQEAALRDGEARAAANAANVAQNSMAAAAASQPRDERLLPITSADIAALEQVFNESDDAKKLFCRGQYAGGVGLAPTPVSAPAPALPAARPNDAAPAQNGAQVPLPPVRPPQRRP
jgi:hypothetical protein